MFVETLHGIKYLLPLASTLLVYSCSNNSKDISTFKALDESLVGSNMIIRKATASSYRALENKLSDPSTSDKAEVWFPKATSIRDLSSPLIVHLQKLKVETAQGKKISHTKMSNLHAQLTNYRKSLLQIDSGMTAVFDTSIVIITKRLDSVENSSKEFVEMLDVSPKEKLISLLSKIENNVVITENKMIQYCTYKVPDPEAYYDLYSVLVGPSTEYVKPGDAIEITAGVGAFTVKVKPLVTVNGIDVPLEADGVTHYKFKASLKPGKHFVPVKVSYTGPGGKKETVNTTVEYTVLPG